jgi:hypothetical protein
LHFNACDSRPQTTLRSTPFHQWVLPSGVLWTEFHYTESGYLLRFPELADYEVSADGRAVSCHPVSGVSDETTRHLYLNQVLPLALSRLGKLVFHASAVELGGEAVVFAGESGRGKSTLAAGFATRGFPFLTDDGLVIEEREAGYQVLPSHPSIRLWEDSQKALVHPETPAADALPFTSKTRFLAGDDIAFCAESRPLRHVYFLGDGLSPHVSFAPMGASEALIELVKHSFLLDVQASDLIVAHFDQLTRLVGRRIYYRLDYPRRFEALAEVRNAILSHCGL